MVKTEIVLLIITCVLLLMLGYMFVSEAQRLTVRADLMTECVDDMNDPWWCYSVIYGGRDAGKMPVR